MRQLKIQQAHIEYDSGLSARDLADSTSLPAFAIGEAVKNINKIMNKADEIKKADRKESILNFISSLLFFIPFIGGAVGGIGMGSLRAILTLIAPPARPVYLSTASLRTRTVPSWPSSAPSRVPALGVRGSATPQRPDAA